MKTQKIINRFKVVGLELLFLIWVALFLFSFSIGFWQFLFLGHNNIVDKTAAKMFKTVDRISDLKKYC